MSNFDEFNSRVLGGVRSRFPSITTLRTLRSPTLVKVNISDRQLLDIFDMLLIILFVSCRLACGARYKTRPGLTYHYTHSHKNLLDDDDEDSGAATPTAGSNSGISSAPSTPLHPSMQGQSMMTPGHGPEMPAGVEMQITKQFPKPTRVSSYLRN